MKDIEIGEWVKGPFANATIEGFIIKKTHNTYSISVKSIEKQSGVLPPHLHVGSIHELPKRVIHGFYRILSEEQQRNLIMLVEKLGQHEWSLELMDKFYPSKKPVKLQTMVARKQERIHSEILNKYVYLCSNSRNILFSYYRKSCEKGLNGQISRPSEINNSKNFDAVISSVVLISQDKEGINYIKSLLNKETMDFLN